MENMPYIRDNRPYTVAEMCHFLKIGKNKGYELVNKRAIRHIKIGNKIRIPVAYLEEYMRVNTVEQ